MNQQMMDGLFDELNAIGRDQVLGGMHKEAVAGYLATGFRHLGTLVKGLSSKGGRKAIAGGLKNVSQKAGGGWKGTWEAGKKLAPAAAAAGVTGAAGYGTYRALGGGSGGQRQNVNVYR